MSDRRELSRAEQVRLRREQAKARRMDRVVKETTRPIPVTTRARQTSTAPKRKPKQNARRRFQIALPHLPAARPNFRAISIPRPRFGWRFVSFVLTALLGAALYLAFNLPQLRVVEAQVVGNQIITPAEVNSVMNLAGQPVFMVSPSEMETRLRLNYPELVSVRVSVDLPNLVTVNVLERKPVIRWEQFGSYTWVAEDGVAFRPRGELVGLISVVAETAPPVTGASSPALAPGASVVSAQDGPMNPAQFISAEMVQAVQGLGGHVPPGQPIVYDERMGFGWDDPRGWRVYFGITAHDVALKMRVYESMVNSLAQRGIRPALINVTYPTAPYYRMTQ